LTQPSDEVQEPAVVIHPEGGSEGGAIRDLSLDLTVGPAKPSATRWAIVTFLALFAMNLLDYTDRFVLSAVMPHVRTDLHMTGVQGGWLTSLFLISYSLFSPVMGYAGDRTKRTRLLALGIGVWSLATLGSGLVTSYRQLCVARAFLGIGEATYGVIAPTMLADLFARETRARIMSGFYLAMPIGGALGVALGGWIGEAYGWHTAFFLVGAPGLAAAIGALFLPEPVRGQSEGVDPARLKDHEEAGASREDYFDLMVNSSYTYSVLGMAFYTFAIGGLSAWLPTFLFETRNFGLTRATSWLGGITLCACLTGMTVGGWLADRLSKTDTRALFLVPGIAMLASIPFVLLALFSTTDVWIFIGVFLAETLMFVNTGPCNAVIANVVAPNMRSAAYAVTLFAVHVLGDIWSPPLIAWVADTFGQRDSMSTPLGQVLASIGAVPTRVAEGSPENWVAGLLVVIPALVLSGVVLLSGARHLPREMALMLAKLKAKPRVVAGPPR
jgi:MFS family permease